MEQATAIARLLFGGIPILTITTLLTRRTVAASLHPVAAMTTQVRAVGSNSLHFRIAEPATHDEIHELVTTMNDMLTRLDDASQRQRRFVSDASHELRTPLSSIRTALEVAELHPDTIDPHTAISDTLADHRRLDVLVHDLLELARLDTGPQSRTQPCDISQIVADVVARRPNDRILISVSTQRATASVRVRDIERLITNLLDNAQRHTKQTVTVDVAIDGPNVRMVVDDDGPGIEESERERVFERFARLDEARGDRDGGTGLGLAICQQIATSHQGKVNIETSPTGGARIVVTLPSTPASSSPPSRQAALRQSSQRR